MQSRTLDISKVGSTRGRPRDPTLRTSTDSSDRKARLTDGFCDLALAIFMMDNSTLHLTLGNELAWDCILLLMEKRRFGGIVSAAARWPDVDSRTFLHELASSMLTSWYVVKPPR
jgi:hypothetical protein